jgi:hypothetical protein
MANPFNLAKEIASRYPRQRNTSCIPFLPASFIRSTGEAVKKAFRFGGAPFKCSRRSQRNAFGPSSIFLFRSFLPKRMKEQI